MEILYTTGETMEEAFFKPIDNLWGLYGLRAKMVKDGNGQYDKSSLFLDFTFNGIIGKSKNLLEYTDSLNNSAVLGWAFSIERVIGDVNKYAPGEKHCETVTEFLVHISEVNATNLTALQSRPVSDNQISPSLFVPKAIIQEAATAQQHNSAEYGDQMVMRIGQYNDGRYVLFLHGDKNETNYPVRIPPGHE